MLVVGDKTATARVVDELGLWAKATAATVAAVNYWRYVADVVVVVEPAATREVRRLMPHVPCCVVSPRPLSVMERCALYDSGVQQVIEPAWLGVELAARLRVAADRRQRAA